MNFTDPLPENDRPAGAEQTDLPALRWMRHAHAQVEVLGEVAQRVRQRRRTRRVVTSGVFAAALVAVMLWRQPRGPNRADHLVAQTTATVSLPQRQVLPDGSVIELRDDAEVTVDYNGPLRRVMLRRGEAHFQVAKNKDRPFVVAAADVEARALGTAFSVQLGKNGVEVLVAEGRVAVIERIIQPPGGGGDAPLAVLEAGNRVVVPTTNGSPEAAASLRAVAVENVTSHELAERLSWRVPRLEFSRAPLSEVVAVMNRHANEAQPVRFAIGDPALRNVKLSGFLRADNVEGLIQLLETNFGVTIERRGDNEIILHRSAEK